MLKKLKILSRLQHLLFLGLCITSSSLAASDSTDTLQETRDFHALAQNVIQDTNKPLILAFKTDNCPYCYRLEQEQLLPRNNNPQYRDKMFIRTFHTDTNRTVIDFDGKEIATDEFVARYQAQLTPTLVFLDKHGHELTEKLIGYNDSYYGAYLDEGLTEAAQALKQGKHAH